MRCIVIIVLLFFTGLAYGQHRVVSGFVRDSVSGEPLIGATIWNEVSKTGTASDHFGHYTLHVFTNEIEHLTASFIGYQAQTRQISANGRLDFFLSSGVDLDEIVVKGQQKIEEHIEMGVLTLPVSQLKTLPAIGEPDVLKALQLMPGIQGGAEGRSGLYVRGGSPDQNLMLLDGAPVYYVNHYGNFLSLFHPEIISHMKLYKGSFPAKYGGRLSSVVDLRMREGNKKAHHGSFGIGLLSADLLLEGPIKKDTTSYLFSVRRFYLDALMRPGYYFISQGYFSLGYNFYDVYGKISHTFNENNRLFFSVYAGNDAYGVYTNPPNENFKGNYRNSWGNILATTRFNTKLSKHFIADFILGYTRYHTGNSQEFEVDTSYYASGTISNVQDYSFKSEFSYTINNWYELSFGAGTVFHRFQPGLVTNKQTEGDSILVNSRYDSQQQLGWEPYAYVENILKAGDYLKLNLGMRYSGYWVDGTNYQKIEPRLLAVLGTSKTGVARFSYSENMQALHLLSYLTVGTPNDLWMPATAKIPPAKARQYSIGYAKSLFESYEIQLEAYRKELSNLIDYKDGASYSSSEEDWQDKVETKGEGLSRGIEILFKKNGGKTTGWLGYTLAKTDRFFQNKNNGKTYPYIYDRRHDLSVVVNHRFNKKFNLSASWVFGTGYPMTLEMGYYQSFTSMGRSHDIREVINPFGLDDNIVLYSGKNGVRMGNSHRLDLGFQINGKTKKGRDTTWSFNIYNLYNQQNPAYYYYDWIDRRDRSKGKTLWQQSGFPIIPSFTYRVSW